MLFCGIGNARYTCSCSAVQMIRLAVQLIYRLWPLVDDISLELFHINRSLLLDSTMTMSRKSHAAQRVRLRCQEV